MVRVTDYHKNPQAASDAPRWRLGDQLNVQLEYELPAAMIEELKSRGHQTIRSDRLATDFGRGQFIFKLDDGYFAASEKRTDGQAVGY
jgi:gamma-glutamyltranspeptidase/glutathione hydrolase